MENRPPVSGASDTAVENSGPALHVNIKTLDSRIFSFLVDRNTLVSAFKEKIAQKISVPVGQQRLIFRGKVLKDDHILSEYHVEHGDTLHLVERQPQTSPGSNTGEAASSNSTGGGQNTAAGGPHNRIGQISHSLVLGTLNLGDPGESLGPDLSRVIGAVLSSLGMGNPVGMQPGVQTSDGNETERTQANAGSQRQGGNQFGLYQALNGQSASSPMQNPVGATMAVPSLNAPIPDSLNTLTEFINRMERALSQNGTQQDQSPDASGSLPTPQLPTNLHGFPTVEALTTVMRHAQRLLSDHVVRALSQTAGRLDQEGRSSDPAVRGQVHSETAQLGVAMQHLGALFLELGRTILNLRVGQLSDQSYVNAGPAVYISPSRPNPIMVQPFPLQTTSLFGGSSGATQNRLAIVPPFASVTRNVNIHIHTGAALASIVPVVGNRSSNGEEVQGQQGNGASGELGQAQVPTGVNVTTTSVPSRPGAGGSQAINPGGPVFSNVSSLNDYIRDIADRIQNGSQAPSGGLANQGQPPGTGVRDNETNHQPRYFSSSTVGKTTQTAITDNQKEKTDLSSSPGGGSHMSGHGEGSAGHSQGNNTQGGSLGVPLGLGLGGLQPKKPVKFEAKTTDRASSSRAVAQQVLQSLSALATRENPNPPPSGQSSEPERGSNVHLPPSRQSDIDLADSMSQLLSSSSVNGLLTRLSQYTGVGSPEVLRNLMQQLTQNPVMRNPLNQLAEQVQTGSFDLSTNMQQMLPAISQALEGIAAAAPQMNPPQDVTRTSDDPQINLREVVQRLKEQNSSIEIFRSLLMLAAQLGSSGSSEENLANAICTLDLAQEFMDMVLHDLCGRVEDGM
ncbi:Ubiquitin-like superfamily protein [Striga hermonthica]|uniref:Ubiquitin-like superfamily protein n=1 Tax=Striga hermonthica TaxID=68872 RepID=A0A9N7MK87_STRHE|nr:Ubiquitin-like superfamily protein [Striga hermonthica]